MFLHLRYFNIFSSSLSQMQMLVGPPIQHLQYHLFLEKPSSKCVRGTNHVLQQNLSVMAQCSPSQPSLSNTLLRQIRSLSSKQKQKKFSSQIIKIFQNNVNILSLEGKDYPMQPETSIINTQSLKMHIGIDKFQPAASTLGGNFMTRTRLGILDTR